MPHVFSRSVATFVLGLSALLWTVASFAADKSETPAKADSDSVFGLTRVWKIPLHVSAENWKTMQPPAGSFFGFGPPPAPGNPGNERKPNDAGKTPPSPPGPVGPGGGFRPGSFGYEFEYTKADVELDGQTLREVGLRFKGNGSYMMSASGRKRPFKIDSNRYVDGQKFHGMQQPPLSRSLISATNGSMTGNCHVSGGHKDVAKWGLGQVY